MTHHRTLIEDRIAEWVRALPDGGLYEPMAYLMRSPAKRIRPTLTLMACELFGGHVEEALEEALGIEVFHNFTLMHDDIMDASPTRRGAPTVHVKWDVPTAILSGDAMLVKAHALMARDTRTADLFGRYALQVCEGQQLDMAFEHRAQVTLAEYRHMIRLKTAVLLSCALQLGALRAGANDEQRALAGRFGEELGMAFQVKDDLLDAFGDPAITGKRRGGDLRAGKRTGLLIHALAWSATNGDTVLARELARAADERDVDAMLDTVYRSGAKAEAEKQYDQHHHAAMEALRAVDAPDARKRALQELAHRLLERTA